MRLSKFKEDILEKISKSECFDAWDLLNNDMTISDSELKQMKRLEDTINQLEEDEFIVKCKSLVGCPSEKPVIHKDHRGNYTRFKLTKKGQNVVVAMQL